MMVMVTGYVLKKNPDLGTIFHFVIGYLNSPLSESVFSQVVGVLHILDHASLSAGRLRPKRGSFL